MTERYDEALDELRTLLNDMRIEAEHVGYGNFPGGDPRDFTPDPECSTEAEQEAHKAACVAWGRGEKPQYEGCGWITPDIHVMRTPFGLGSYVIRDEMAADVAERLERILNRLENP